MRTSRTTTTSRAVLLRAGRLGDCLLAGITVMMTTVDRPAAPEIGGAVPQGHRVDQSDDPGPIFLRTRGRRRLRPAGTPERPVDAPPPSTRPPSTRKDLVPAFVDEVLAPSTRPPLLRSRRPRPQLLRATPSRSRASRRRSAARFLVRNAVTVPSTSFVAPPRRARIAGPPRRRRA